MRPGDKVRLIDQPALEHHLFRNSTGTVIPWPLSYPAGNLVAVRWDNYPYILSQESGGSHMYPVEHQLVESAQKRISPYDRFLHLEVK